MHPRQIFVIAIAVACGCGGTRAFPDAGAQDAPAHDASTTDAATIDAATTDAAMTDAAMTDARTTDASTLDGGPDASIADASVADASIADAAPICPVDGASCSGGVCCGGACVAGACCTATDCGTGGGTVCTAAHTCENVAGTLDGLLWQLPCAAGASGTSCATTPTTTTSTTLGGTAGVTYDVTVHIRGVIEQKTYPGACATGAWAAGGQINGDPYNIYQLTVSSPAQTFFVNAGTSYITNVWPIDYTTTFRVDAGATVTLFANAVDGAEIRNLDAGGAPVSVSGTQVAQPYDGQFIELDVVSVAPDPVASGAVIGGGVAGSALQYAGGQLATIARAAALEPADLTIEAWLESPGLGGPYDTVFGKTYGAGTSDSYTLWFESGTLRSGLAAANGFQQVATPWAPAGTWHHAATTYASATGTATFYLDGAVVGCYAAPAPLTYDAHDVLIGGDIENGTPNGFWTGAIDEVRVFGAVRTPAQIWADLHTHRLGPTTGLVGEWTFDEGAGQSAADSSGSGNPAVLGATSAIEASDPTWITSTVPY
jgi:hypothetical protein